MLNNDEYIKVFTFSTRNLSILFFYKAILIRFSYNIPLFFQISMEKGKKKTTIYKYDFFLLLLFKQLHESHFAALKAI